MGNFKRIQGEQLEANTFQMIGKEWMLVTAENEGKVNTMTASWGGFGVMWAKNVAYIVIRPQRFTKEFIDASDTFSLSFLGEEYRKVLNYLGTVSGRAEDKIQKSGLTVAHQGQTPYFEESNLVMICRKLYAQGYQPEGFVEEELKEKFYAKEDYHTLYIAEITDIFIKE